MITIKKLTKEEFKKFLEVIQKRLETRKERIENYKKDKIESFQDFINKIHKENEKEEVKDNIKEDIKLEENNNNINDKVEKE